MRSKSGKTRGGSKPRRTARRNRPQRTSTKAQPKHAAHALLLAQSRIDFFDLLRTKVARLATAGVATLQGAAGADNSIVFEITWSGGTAALDHLVYNGLLVDEAPEYGGNRVSVKFSRPRELAHVFEWSLLFPGETLQNLSATAKVDGGDPSPLLASKTPVDTRWAASASC